MFRYYLYDYRNGCEWVYRKYNNPVNSTKLTSD